MPIGFLSFSPKAPPRAAVRATIVVMGLAGLWLLPPTTSARAARAPEWVERSGVSDRYPRGIYVVGFHQARGEDAPEAAKQGAAADLARQISVRIESTLSDSAREEGGEYRYRIDAVTRATSDVHLTDVHFEVYAHRKTAWALAVVQRAAAGRARLADRDRALAELAACLARGELEVEIGDVRGALRAYRSCRTPLAEAVQHAAVAGALLGDAGRDASVLERLAEAAQTIDHRLDSLLKAPATSLETAADSLALQLVEQGISKRTRLVVDPLRYGATRVSSAFGREAALELERAIARSPDRASGDDTLATPGSASSHPIVIRGAYLERGDDLRLSVTAGEADTGRLRAGAEVVVPLSALPSDLERRPANLDKALEDQRILAEGDSISGDLKLEIWTDRGHGSVVYDAGEELRLYMRVTRPAWIRLVYVLQDGTQVALVQAHRIGPEAVNAAVPYPEPFLVVPPFGIELIHAMAFTQEPPPLRVEALDVQGTRYDVVRDGIQAVVRMRGLIRQRKQVMAEDFVTVTTVPRPATRRR